MKSIFEQYPETPVSADESEKKPTDHSFFTKREMKVLKQFRKQLKKYNKRQKETKESHVEEQNKRNFMESSIDEKGTSNLSKGETQKKENRDEKNFWNKLGEVFLKVVPKIICTVVSAAITTIFSCNFKWKRKAA